MNVGMIGCGYVADHYLSTWSRHPGLVLKGVADRDATRRDAFARAYGVAAYPSNEALLAEISQINLELLRRRALE